MKSQLVRAATSVALNIAEGSIGQTDVEQSRFLGMAIRSLLETVACQHIIRRRNFSIDPAMLDQAYSDAERLVAKLQAFRSAISPQKQWVRESQAPYESDDV